MITHCVFKPAKYQNSTKKIFLQKKQQKLNSLLLPSSVTAAFDFRLIDLTILNFAAYMIRWQY